MNDSAILHPLTLPLQGLRLIEASAGTGKTYTIAMLYLRLVLGHQRGLPAFSGRRYLPPDILVLTFTEAAAGELRERIRARLIEAAQVFRRGPVAGTDAMLRELAGEYDDERHGEAAFLLEQAAQWLDEAAISTIHAWCLRVLQQHAFDSGSLFSQTLVQELAPLRQQVVRDVWRQWFYPLPAAQAAVITALLQSPDALADRLQPLLGAGAPAPQRAGRPAAQGWREAWDGLAGAEASLVRTREALWQRWDEAADTILGLLAKAVADGVLNKGSYKQEWLQEFPEAMRLWQAGGRVPPKLVKMTPAELGKTRKGQTRPEHPWFAQVEAYLACADHLDQPRAAFELALLTDLARAVSAGMASRLRERAELGFDDLLRRVAEALQGPHGERLAQRLRERYPVALIDEFQDTDPLQFGIFSQVYADQPDTALLMIGDPKQAIYSFRGADLPTYLKARARAERPHHTLDTNFRSDRALVAAVNGIFRHASQWPGGAFAQDLPFQPVQASREHSLLRRRTGDGQLQSLDALQLDLPEVLEACGKTRAMPILASHCANTIAAWLDEGRAGRLGFLAQAGDRDLKRLLGPGDIAVLVRSRHEAAVLRRALQARDIPSVYGSDRESVYASAEAEQLQIWLEAFAEPAREDRLRLALATPALGRTWTELDHLRVDERTWEDEVEQVRRCHDIWRAQGVLAAVRQWLFQHQVPARLLHPGCADGERSLTNLLHLAELLQSAATGLHGEQALIRHLAECREGGESAGSKDALVRLESDSARVRVVTLHQSKGLEYPLVCMPFSALPAGGAQTAAWRRYHDAAGNLVLDLDSGKDSAASLQSAAEQLQEDLRLFYVGLTRARHLLWLALLPVGQGVKAGGEGDPARALLQQTPWAHVLTGTDEVAAADLLPALQALQAAVPELVLRRWRPDQEPLRRWQVPARPQLARPARVFSGLTGEPWRISSYSGLRQADALAGDSRDAWPPPQTAETDEAGADSAGAETFREQVLAGLSALPRGAEIGTFWHGLLEEAAALGFGTDAASLARLDESIAGQCQLRQWQDQVEPLRQALRGWLRHPLSLPAQPGGEVVAPVPLSALTRYQVELEFWMASQGVDVGTLDALVCRHTLSARPRPAMAAARLNGLFKGFMDLVFEHQGRFYVADYKSNHLGDGAAAYQPERLVEDIARHRYDLQYTLYLLALHRQLRARLPDYDYDRHIGGAVYIYLRGWDGRGGGIHAERPPRQLVDALDTLFAGGEGEA